MGAKNGPVGWNGLIQAFSLVSMTLVLNRKAFDITLSISYIFEQYHPIYEMGSVNISLSGIGCAKNLSWKFLYIQNAMPSNIVIKELYISTDKQCICALKGELTIYLSI